MPEGDGELVREGEGLPVRERLGEREAVLWDSDANVDVGVGLGEGVALREAVVCQNPFGFQ